MKVRVLVNNADDYINKYNDDRFSRDLNDYIIDELKGVPIRDCLNIEVYSKFDMNDLNKEKFVKLYRNNFLTDMNDYIMYFKISFIMSVILCLFGILFIIFSNIIDASILKEILLIVGWVGIWESVYNVLFVESRNLFIIKRYKKILNAKIVFKKMN